MLAGMKVAFDLGRGQSHRGPSCHLPALQVPKGMVWVTLELPGLQGLGPGWELQDLNCSWDLEVSLLGMTKNKKVGRREQLQERDSH